MCLPLYSIDERRIKSALAAYEKVCGIGGKHDVSGG